MTDKGTITWLPIEGAPKDGTRIMLASHIKLKTCDDHFYVVWTRWKDGKWEHQHHFIYRYYALINPPDTEAE